MKKKVMGWLTAFALAFVLGLVTFSEDASASTNKSMINSTNASIGEWEEYFRDESSWFSQSRFFTIKVQNISFEGGEYMFRLYKPGTTTVMFERKGYVEQKSIVEHEYYVSSMSFSADAVWYRKSGSNAQILGSVYAKRN
ncbi:hypothetical protein [Lysinibacillus fusiformis]|uniref:hypothetical protein n=1 Tax=Lysinibacillus fusiformis TaxID=28031 RepID=UPI000468E32A|nr:hypothetical protein [Lysinibacillus fusiformis]